LAFLRPTSRRVRAARGHALSAVSAALLSASCKGEPAPIADLVKSDAGGKVKAVAPDRLAPGELAEGDAAAFGFRAPREMKLDARFPDAAHFSGRVTAERLSNYVRERVLASHVEVGAARTVFPRVRIKGNDSAHVYRVEIIPARSKTKLVIQLLSAPPAVRGLTEAERWKRAGIGPDGKPLDDLK
jgi:hypothetical protein